MGSASPRDHLMKLLEPVVSAEGLDLEDITVTQAGRRRVLRVIVDRDGGVSLDDVADVSQAVSAALDEDDSMGQAAYTLEVSSPGVDRPLTEPRHWRRAAKRLVKAELRDGTVVEGRITAADDGGVELDVAGAARRIEYEDLARGRVQVEFRRIDDVDGDEG
ncbi:ribosome maturation factor RimP [Actinomadura sp. ATCC 31491]|uniref:Ribosome maturation factor RimP n=1 Tax=Actinomadura luzonensis TaxID=2805427 RepID=A0ABT0G4W1_9ACTN|nr:ribosome maturation factor RimP [Actinomadura luzonensis]MCK2219639.1 ribosome maturation factor RimP [Actinomadura luzonensis]